MAERVTVAPATRQDFLDFLGQIPPYRCIAWCGRTSEKILAIGGVMILPNAAGAYAFLEAIPEARRFHKTLHQSGLRFMAALAQSNIGRVTATTTTEVPRADEWLERLGFIRHEAGGMKVFVHGDSPQPEL